MYGSQSHNLINSFFSFLFLIFFFFVVDSMEYQNDWKKNESAETNYYSPKVALGDLLLQNI